MVAAGALGEVGGHGQDLGAGQRERPVQLREADVVADRQAEGRAVEGRGDGSVAGGHARGFRVGRALVDRDVEEVDLAVGRGDVAVRVDEDAGVGGALRVVGPLGKAADEDPGAVPARDRDEGVRVLAGDRPGARPVAVVRPAVLEVLRQGDQAGAAVAPPRPRARSRARCCRRRRRWRRAARARRRASWGHRRGSRHRRPVPSASLGAARPALPICTIASRNVSRFAYAYRMHMGRATRRIRARPIDRRTSAPDMQPRCMSNPTSSAGRIVHIPRAGGQPAWRPAPRRRRADARNHCEFQTALLTEPSERDAIVGCTGSTRAITTNPPEP